MTSLRLESPSHFYVWMEKASVFVLGLKHPWNALWCPNLPKSWFIIIKSFGKKMIWSWRNSHSILNSIILMWKFGTCCDWLLFDEVQSWYTSTSYTIFQPMIVAFMHLSGQISRSFITRDQEMLNHTKGPSGPALGSQQQPMRRFWDFHKCQNNSPVNRFFEQSFWTSESGTIKIRL